MKIDLFWINFCKEFACIPITIIALLLFPYVRYVIKRTTQIAKIKLMCIRKKYRLIPTHFWWIFGTIKGENCDFYIETPDKVYAVKLCGTISRLIMYKFVNNRRYATKNFRFLFFKAPRMSLTYSAVASIQYKDFEKPIYNFRYRCPDDLYAKEFVPVLLMSPVSSGIMVQSQESGAYSKDVSNGEYIMDECYFYSGKSFRKVLKRKQNLPGNHVYL